MTTDVSAAPRSHLARWLGLAALIIVFDQATKLYFDNAFSYGQRLNVLPFFDFTLMYNRGAAFSFLAREEGWQRWLFTLLGVGAAVFITWMLRRTKGQPRFCLALTLIMGGALGNVIDRVAYGHVVDFLLFYWRDWYYPAFNLADVGITCGAVLLVLDEILRARKTRAAGG
ncbi:lipoprotein signal peptidase [Bordetella ansorpii]|uniref:Lipoprotein signal peptidase n=1 Tax=Bordetella ansorpii TaxID=288768 RepID=A0A157REP5_9BORD|nr:signal peptidase II [Bordetella ansorpii]SAI56472.1 lipoprotein signal peptidase [Bordetella ansorpii]